MTQSRAIVFVAAALAVAAGAGLSTVSALNSSPTVNVVRLANVKNQTWPGDFNGDGIVDLAVTGTPDAQGNGTVSALLGDGHGKLTAAPQTGVPVTGTILGVGDFDNNGRLDLIVAHQTSQISTSVGIVKGQGDGTFGENFLVDGFDAPVVFALSADLDGDGNRDLVVGLLGSHPIYVFPGTGNLQFGPRVALTAGAFPNGGAIADIDGDGRNDIVIANLEGKSVTVFRNEGNFAFSSSAIQFDRFATDAAVADLNGDGKADLVVSAATGSHDGSFGQQFTDGVAYVLIGNGDGTFAAPAAYLVARGAYRVVIGDFTRDGIPDIATGNRSAIFLADCGPAAKTWDSVSILPGLGNGTFGGSSWFSVGDQQRVDSPAFRNTLSSLSAADVDGDRMLDLIVSDGVIFRNRPLDPNWPPSVAVGSQLTGSPGGAKLFAIASDSDQDMLTYAWTDSGGTSIPPVPNPCVTPSTAGNHTFTVTVTDRDGNTASASTTIDLGGGSYKPPSITITAPAAGEIVRAGAPYTMHWSLVPGSNAIARLDVLSSTDGTVASTIAECENLPASATACTWNNPGPASGNATVSVRADDSETITIATSGTFTISDAPPGDNAPPAPWLHQDVGTTGAPGDAFFQDGVFTVIGSGADIWNTSDAFHFLYQPLPLQFETVARVDRITATTSGVEPWTKAGLMVRTSLAADAPEASLLVTPGNGVVFQHRLANGITATTHGPALTAPIWLRLTGFNGRIWAYYRKNITDPWTLIGSDVLSGYNAAFVGMAVTSHKFGTRVGAQFSHVIAQPMPAWTTIAGSTGTDGTIFGIGGTTGDIWNTADSYAFMAAPLDGDGSIVARVTNLPNTDPWAKAGVMMRDSAAANAKHVFVGVTPGHGVNIIYRSATGGQSTNGGSIAGVVPGWLRIVRAGNVFTAARSIDGVTFTTVGSVTVSMGSSLLVGMADSNHNTSAAASATFDDALIAR
jgi:hypothetical protein